MPSKKKKDNNWLVMYDCLGLEYITDINKYKKEVEVWEKSKIISVLKEESHPPKPHLPIHLLIMRARANPQRNYEIYTFLTENSIDEKSIKDMFKDDPQFIVDLIRERGNKIYSDRIDTKSRVIV